MSKELVTPCHGLLKPLDFIDYDYKGYRFVVMCKPNRFCVIPGTSVMPNRPAPFSWFAKGGKYEMHLMSEAQPRLFHNFGKNRIQKIPVISKKQFEFGLLYWSGVSGRMNGANHRSTYWTKPNETVFRLSESVQGGYIWVLRLQQGGIPRIYSASMAFLTQEYDGPGNFIIDDNFTNSVKFEIDKILNKY